MTNDKPSALKFALLIDSVPELTEDFVTAAYKAATTAWQNRDDVERLRAEEVLYGGVVATRDEIPSTSEDDLTRHLAAPVDGRRIVKPILAADTPALAAAAQRFADFTGRLPHLGTWDDRQAVWNLLSGTRVGGTPMTDCERAYARRAV